MSVSAEKRVKDTNSQMHQKLDISDKPQPGRPMSVDGVAAPTLNMINNIAGAAINNVEAVPSYESPYCGLKRIRLPNNETLEMAILAWYNMQVSSGVKVRGVDIQEKASTIAKEMGEDCFVASSGWLWKFKMRNGIKITKRANNDKYNYGSIHDCEDGNLPATEAVRHKRKRASLTVSQKLRILEELENGSSPANICAKYGIARQTVSDIRKRKDKLRRFASDFVSSNVNDRSSIFEACQDKPLDELLWIDDELVEVNVEEDEEAATEERVGSQLEDEEDDQSGANSKRPARTGSFKFESAVSETEEFGTADTIVPNTPITKSNLPKMLFNEREKDKSRKPNNITADTNEARKRVRVTVAQKLDIINKLGIGVSVAKICEEYGIKKQTVSDIKKSKRKLELRQRLILQRNAMDGAGKPSRSLKQETILVDTVDARFQEDNRVHPTKEGISEPAELNPRCLGANDFSASDELLKFRNTYRLSEKVLKQIHGQETVSDSFNSTQESISDSENNFIAENPLRCVSGREYSLLKNETCTREPVEEAENKINNQKLHPESNVDRGKISCVADGSNGLLQTGKLPEIDDETTVSVEDRRDKRDVEMSEVEDLKYTDDVEVKRKLGAVTPVANICTAHGLAEEVVSSRRDIETFGGGMSTSASTAAEPTEPPSENSRRVYEAVYQWYIEEYKCRGHVNPQDILANAARLARTMGAKYFTASVKWLCGFKYQYMLDDEMLSLEEIDGTKPPRVRLTVAQKLAILGKLDKGVSVTKVSAEFGVAKQTVSGIRKSRRKIEAFASDGSNSEITLQCERKVIRAPDALDEAVHKWYLHEHSTRGRVCGRELQQAARRLAQEQGIEHFSASSGWLWKFRTRHGLAVPKESRDETSSDVPSGHLDPI